MHAFKPTVSMLAAAALMAAGCATAPSESHRETLAAAQDSAHSSTLPRWQTEAGGNAAIHTGTVPTDGPAVQGAASPPGAPAKGSPTPGQNASNLQARAAAPPGSAPPIESGKPAPSLQDVIAEIDSLGDVNPAVQKRLLEELRQSDPALWPMLTQQIRATLAYQKQHAARQPENAAPDQVAARRPGSTERRASGAAPAAVAEAPAASNSKTPEQVAAAATAALPAALPEQGPARQLAESAAPPAAAGAIQQVAYEKPAAPGDWNQSLAETIQGLELQARQPTKDGDAVAQHARLRMLYLIAGRRDDALQPIPGATAAQQQYWSEQLYALSAYLDSQRIADAGRRAAEAVLHLSEAVASLGELGPLVVKNLNFCTEVTSYGVFKRLDGHDFRPGQQVLLYAEVDNFKSEETRDGFHTALQSSYQILDAQGRRVAHDDFALTEEHCQNRRRDYFVRYFLTLPSQIYEGRYTLELTVEDTLGRKIGQSTMQFSVASKPK